MVRNPDISSMTACLDGVAVALDEGECPPRKSRTQTSYCVQYALPTVNPERVVRFMHVAADNPADAVEAVKAAHPLADILSVG